VGILSTPYAIKQGGWLGLVILCLFAILAWYTGVLLRRCLDSKEGLETYPDIGHAAFGTTGRIAISVCNLINNDCDSMFAHFQYDVNGGVLLC
jgi:vesicular inhibitory amino acid transporter